MAPPCLTVYDLSNCFALRFPTFLFGCCCIFRLLHIFRISIESLICWDKIKVRQSEKNAKERKSTTHTKKWKTDWHVWAQRMINIHIAHSVRIYRVLMYVYNAIIYCMSCSCTRVCMNLFEIYLLSRTHEMVNWYFPVIILGLIIELKVTVIDIRAQSNKTTQNDKRIV